MCNQNDCNRKWPGGELTLSKARAYLLCHVPADAPTSMAEGFLMQRMPRMCPNDRAYLLNVHREDLVLKAWRDGYAYTDVSNNGGS